MASRQSTWTLPAGEWIAIEVGEPAILRPTGVGEAEILYHPEIRPASDTDALRSIGPGVCYLHSPGVWFIKYDASSGSLGVTQIPAQGGEFSWTQAEPGYTFPATQATVSVATSLTTILAANRQRKYVLLQNKSGANTIYVGLGTAFSPTTLTGLQVAPGEAYEMCGPGLYRGIIRGIASGAACPTYVLEGT